MVDTDADAAGTETEAELVDANDTEGNPIKLLMITEPASGQRIFSQVMLEEVIQILLIPTYFKHIIKIISLIDYHEN